VLMVLAIEEYAGAKERTRRTADEAPPPARTAPTPAPEPTPAGTRA
jgi:hypothetical protein